jgi:hypothetical protein
LQATFGAAANPDSSQFNNWSIQGNVNPFTGQSGTRNPYANSWIANRRHTGDW